jgi:hypothetical protein
MINPSRSPSLLEMLPPQITSELFVRPIAHVMGNRTFGPQGLARH